MPRPLEFDIQNVTGVSTDEDGFTSLTHDDDGEQGGAPVPIQHWHGIWSVPLEPTSVDPNSLEPDPTQSAASLTAYEGALRHCFPLSSPAVIKNLPIGVKGETIVHNSFGAFSRYHKDGSISHSTTSTGGGADGQTVADRTTPTMHTRFGPWGRETFDATGYRIKHTGGARFALGYAGGLFPGLSSYARIEAHMFEVNAAAIALGPKGSICQSVAQVIPLVELLQSVMLAVEAVFAAAATITTATPGPSVMPAAAPAIADAQALLATALEDLATVTTIG